MISILKKPSSGQGSDFLKVSARSTMRTPLSSPQLWPGQPLPASLIPTSPLPTPGQPHWSCSGPGLSTSQTLGEPYSKLCQMRKGTSWLQARPACRAPSHCIRCIGYILGMEMPIIFCQMPIMSPAQTSRRKLSGAVPVDQPGPFPTPVLLPPPAQGQLPRWRRGCNEPSPGR